VTTPDQPDVPIIPGPAPYEPPTAPLPPPVPEPYQPPAPPPAQPVYYQHPPQAPTWNPGRAAGNTVVVVVVLVGLFCFLPAFLCLVLAALGNLTK
jgi:hypothetical protein